MRVLQDKKDFTLESLIAAAYDSYLPWFEKPMPALLRAYDALAASDPLKAKLRDPIARLRNWDYRFSVSSVATSLAVFWGTEVSAAINQLAIKDPYKPIANAALEKTKDLLRAI